MRGTVVVVALLVACGGEKELTLDEVLKQHKASVEPVVAMFEKIAKAPLPAPTGTIKLAGSPMVVRSTNGNTAMAFDGDLKDLGKYDHTTLRTSDYSVVNDCYLVVREGLQADRGNQELRHKPWPNVAESWLKRCATLRYLVVMKVLEFQDTKYVDDKTFGGGRVRAEVLVFDLKTGDYAGGVTASAESSTYVTNADDDLTHKFYESVRSAITAQLPDAVF